MYHTKVVWNQAHWNYDVQQICHSAFFKDRAKNVKVRHEKMAKNSQKWVQNYFGMSHMLDNNICNLFLFNNFFLLVLLRPCFWAILKKITQKQGPGSTKRKKLRNKKMLQMLLSNICDIPKKIWTHFCLFLAIFSCLTLTFLALSLIYALWQIIWTS